jgi:hypothetical protein
VVALIAAGVRLIFWLLQPVWPYLLALALGLGILRFARWYRQRW